jgi:hypothetical protein
MAVITIPECVPRHRRLARSQARLRFLVKVFLALGLMLLVVEDVGPLNRDVIDPPDRPSRDAARGVTLTGGGHVLTLGGNTATE